MNTHVPNTQFYISSPSKIRLNKRSVEAAIENHVRGRHERHWFPELPGMFLQITKNGCASYALRFRKPSGGNGDFSIGRVSKITLEMAKLAAQQKIAALALHSTDPVEARRAVRVASKEKKAHTFAALAEAFMSARENLQLSPKTNNNRRFVLDRHILPRIGKLAVADLRKANVKECLHDIQQAVAASKNAKGFDGRRTAVFSHGLIKRIFSWAMGEDRCESNPASFRKMFDDTPVKRIGALNDDRLRILWMALEEEAAKGWGTATAIACQLSMLTLQRPNEVVGAHKDDVHFDERLWRIPAIRYP